MAFRQFLVLLLPALCGGIVVTKTGEPVSADSTKCACPSINQYYVGGQLSSPGWSGIGQPNQYCGGLNCVYVLNAQDGERVQLSFVYFNTEKFFDNITLLDGDKPDNDEAIIARISGPTTPTTQFISGQQSFTLVFKTDLGGNQGGWLLQWQSTTATGCGATNLNGTQAVIQTPNYPYNYPTNLICAWNYTAASGSLAQVSFSSDADTEQGYDVVTIHGGAPISYSGSYGPSNFQPVVSASRQISLEFHSDQSVIFNGFQATFSGFTPPQECDCGPQQRTLTEATGTLAITSPNFGNGQSGYCRNANCQWIVRVPDTFKAHISFLSFDMETGYDTLTIKNDINGHTLETCTGHSCPTAQSTTNFLTLNFHTDGSINKDGFSAIVTAVTS